MDPIRKRLKHPLSEDFVLFKLDLFSDWALDVLFQVLANNSRTGVYILNDILRHSETQVVVQIGLLVWSSDDCCFNGFNPVISRSATLCVVPSLVLFSTFLYSHSDFIVQT